MSEAFSGLRSLVDRARAGDREALSRLIELHEPIVVKWARRRLGYPLRTLEETRDILHDAYQVVMRRMPEFVYEDSRSFARWLRGIITRIVLQKAGASHLRRRLELPDDAPVPSLDATPSSVVMNRELLLARFALLRRFPRLDRMIYRLRMRGFSSDQIGPLVGMTGRGVRQRFARCEARIRLQMQRLAGVRSDDRQHP